MQHTGLKRFSSKKRILLALAFILIVTAISLSFTVFSQNRAEGQYFTQPVEHGPLRAVVNATGNVQAVVTVQVGSQVSGQIEALYADYNSKVKRGQLLAKIDPRNFQAQVENSKANLAAAESHVRATEADLQTQQANLVSAKANLDGARVARDNDELILKRYTKLFKSGLVAQNDLDTVKANADSSKAKYKQALAAVQQVEAQINSQNAQVQQARAQVVQAKADLDRAQLSVEYCDIYSPVDGVVVSRSIDVGQTVAASLSAPLLFVIVNDLTKMQVNASIDEADIGRISNNVDVKFSVDAFPSETFAGKIAEIRLNPQTIQNVVTYSVIISVDNDDLRLKPGMTANITITVDKRDSVLKMQNAALRYLPPGMTRDKEAALIKSAQGALSESLSESDSVSKSEASSLPGKRNSALGNRLPILPSSNFASTGSTGKGRQEDMMSAALPALAPGQMWKVTDKIRFPAPPRHGVKPAIVWTLDANNKPEPKHVMIGITDGAYTELVSGDLKVGDPVIIADSSQETQSSNANSGVRSPFAPRRSR